MRKTTSKKHSDRQNLLGSLFIEAGKRGISQADLRDVITPRFLGKRLSQASEKEISKLRSHITGKDNSPRPPLTSRGGGTKYPSSMEGLRQEVCDIARARWGESWEISLNAFCRRFGVAKWQWLNVTHAVAVKKRLKEMEGRNGDVHHISRLRPYGLRG